MATSSKVIALFTHPAAYRRAPRPARFFSVYEEELAIARRHRARFTNLILGTTAMLLAVASVLI